jgi:hypothetical protein
MNSNDIHLNDAGKATGTNQKPMSRATTMERRQFLKWMGLAGVVAVVGAGAGLRAVGNALAASGSAQQASPQASESDVVQPTLIPTLVAEPTPTPTAVASQSTTSSTCVVRCPNGCSYPGRCKRYMDSNGNNRCDWGECM